MTEHYPVQSILLTDLNDSKVIIMTRCITYIEDAKLDNREGSKVYLNTNEIYSVKESVLAINDMLNS